MKLFKGAAICVAALLFVVLSSNCIAYAGNYYTEYNAADKLKRGLTNIVTSPVEIIRNVYIDSSRENIGYGLTFGLGKGIFQTVMRLGAGAVETLTFPFNFPDEFKDPIVEPEYVWEEWY